MAKESYFTDESSHSGHVSEPVVSYGIAHDVVSLKMEAIGELMNIFDPELLSRAVGYLRSLGKEEKLASIPPCQFTPDELKVGIRIAKEQSEQGLGLTNEEMRNRKRPWRKS